MTMRFFTYLAGGWLIRVLMVPTVLRRQMAPGAAWAWLGIVFLHPYIGLALYVLVGETPLSPVRAEIHRKLAEKFRGSADGASKPPDEAGVDPIYHPMALLAEKLGGMPIRCGNAFDLLRESADLVQRLTADIDAAQTQVLLNYYIFACDHTARAVADALVRAAARGVHCRLLVDAVASRYFFHSGALGPALRAAKVEVVPAMRVTSLKRGLPRADLRNHRKLAVIDSRIAFAGSHNLINPDYGGVPAGPWIDLSARFTGPIVLELENCFLEDWAFETGQMLDHVAGSDMTHQEGQIPMQAVPTGPSPTGGTYRRLLLGAIQSARQQIILTTPYFVPDEPAIIELIMAADRGVDARLILPKRADHFFTAAAGRAHFSRLMDAGISIYQYKPGLLHSKTATVDDAFALFGSANLDVRSFNLNFELSTLIYGREPTSRIRAVQMDYLKDSDRLDPQEWAARSTLRQYADGAVSLISPLL